MNPESPESPEWIAGLPGKKESGKSGISIDTGLRTSPESGPVRIILSEVSSRALEAAGEAFLIVGRGSHPDGAGRMVIHCLPIPKAQADAACRVAMGQARAVRCAANAPPSHRDRAPRVKTADDGASDASRAHER